MKLSRIIAVAGLIIGLSAMVIATSTAGTVTMTATAEITTSIVETVTTNLNFGTIDLNPLGDTITIAAIAGPATPVATGASVIALGTGTSGLITVTCGVVVDIDVTYPAVDVTLTSGGDSLTIVAATIGANSQYENGVTAFTTDGTNPALISVGGIIVIPAGQAAGTYTGSMSLTLNYS